MRSTVFGCLALCAVLAFAGCAKEDVVKKEEPITAPAPAPEKPAAPEAAPAPEKPAPAETKPAETAPAPRQPAGEPVTEEKKEPKEQAPALSQLEKVYFDFDSAALSEAARDQLKKNFDALKKSSAKVEIEGHCDERGSDEYNLALGDRRAKAAKSYLVTLGLKADRLSTISYGKEKPADPGHDEAAWAKNRRAEFIIVK